MIALVCNSLLFLLVGISIDLPRLLGRIDVILVAIILVLIARALTVYSMVPVTIRLFSLPRVSMGERHIMWWGGLKGGLAIAIVMSIPDELAGKSFLVDLTLGVVMFSLLVNASTIRPLIKVLGIDRLTEDEQLELQQALTNARSRSNDMLARFHKSSLISSQTLNRISGNISNILSSRTVKVNVDQRIRHLYISALRMENESLKQYFDIGLIPY